MVPEACRPCVSSHDPLMTLSCSSDPACQALRVLQDVQGLGDNAWNEEHAAELPAIVAGALSLHPSPAPLPCTTALHPCPVALPCGAISAVAIQGSSAGRPSASLLRWPPSWLRWVPSPAQSPVWMGSCSSLYSEMSRSMPRPWTGCCARRPGQGEGQGGRTSQGKPGGTGQGEVKMKGHGESSEA